MVTPASPERCGTGWLGLVSRGWGPAVTIALFVWPGAPAVGWTADGHRKVSTAALELLVGTDIRFDPAERRAIVEASVQPDLMRPRELTQLRDCEAPDHYLNLERLAGRPLPVTRSGWIAMAVAAGSAATAKGRSDWSLAEVGTLPYAIIESTQRLAVVFAQLRRRPEDAFLRSLAAYLAGVMAHYAQDLHQPLHTTIHHDGRALPDGGSPKTGIHRLADGLLRVVPESEPPQALGLQARAREPLFAAVVGELRDSHALVDRVYALEPQLRGSRTSGPANAELRTFAAERYRSAARFTADLIATAWRLADRIELPSWQHHGRSKSKP